MRATKEKTTRAPDAAGGIAAAKSDGLLTRCTQAVGTVRGRRDEEVEVVGVVDGRAGRGTKARRVAGRLGVGLDENDDGMLMGV